MTLNYTARQLDSAVFCSECYGPMLYVGGGATQCRAHPDGSGINIFEVVRRLATKTDEARR